MAVFDESCCVQDLVLQLVILVSLVLNVVIKLVTETIFILDLLKDLVLLPGYSLVWLVCSMILHANDIFSTRTLSSITVATSRLIMVRTKSAELMLLEYFSMISCHTLRQSAS